MGSGMSEEIGELDELLPKISGAIKCVKNVRMAEKTKTEKKKKKLEAGYILCNRSSDWRPLTQRMAQMTRNRIHRGVRSGVAHNGGRLVEISRSAKRVSSRGRDGPCCVG